MRVVHARRCGRSILTLALIAALGFVAWSAATAQAQSAANETVPEHSVWLHENIFEAAHPTDVLFYWCLYLTGAVCIGVFVIMAWFLVKYRHQAGRQAIFTHGNMKLELAWTLIPTIILAATAACSQDTWSRMKNWPTVEAGEPQPVRINVIAQQFQWNFHYPGRDGKFGPTRTELQVKGNPDQQIGLDRSDPAAKDDIVTSMLYVPVNRKVFIQLTSLDVLHSFFLPNFRIKQDAVPGLAWEVWLEASKTSKELMGTDSYGNPKPFDIICAELCGNGHYTMRGQMFVVPEDAYNKFLADQTALLGLGGAAEEGY